MSNTHKHQKMKRSLLLFFLISYLAGHAQDRGVLQGANARIFELSDITDTIQFLKLDADTTVRKPALIVLQGSLPIPLAIEYPSGYHFTSFPFALGKSTETFHILNISMPFVPLLARPEELSANGSLREVPTNYNKANHLQTYVRRTNKVIEFLRKQAWVEPGEIILFGHSQGGYVALKVAGNNPHISKIGLSRFRIYASGTNLWTKQQYSGYSPEFPGSSVFTSGIDYNPYPISKTYLLGFDVSF